MEPKTEIAHIKTPVAKYTLDFNTGVIKAEPIITRGDSIRSMTDEELAEWIANEIWKAFAQGAGNPFFNQEDAVKLENQEWLDWLKQEVE